MTTATTQPDRDRLNGMLEAARAKERLRIQSFRWHRNAMGAVLCLVWGLAAFIDGTAYLLFCVAATAVLFVSWLGFCRYHDDERLANMVRVAELKSRTGRLEI